MKKISVFIPCLNEEKNVLWAYRTVKKIISGMKKYDHEIILIDNGSTDTTRDVIRQIASRDKKAVGIFLSRNFGPEGTGQAGTDFSTGDAFISIGADLQDPPELIPLMVRKWEEGYDTILGIYDKPVDNFIVSWLRITFYRIFKSISEIEVPVNSTGFGLLDRRVLSAMDKLPEKYRFSRGIIAWVGFKKYYFNYKRRKRLRGKSTYNIFSYLKLAERGLFGFSYLILDMIAYLGFILVGLSFLFISAYLLFFFLYGNPIKGAVTILVAVVFFGGMQLLAVSIIGKYIQIIVEETKRRPNYIVEETVNCRAKR